MHSYLLTSKSAFFIFINLLNYKTMKNIKILILAMFLATIAQGQITLLHTFDTASSCMAHNQLMIINFTVSGERYVKINQPGMSIEIYDMNYNLQKKIEYSGSPSNWGQSILYLSQNLFSTDSKIDFMYCYYDSLNYPNTQIYNEDGTLLFQADSLGPLILPNIPQQQYPIYNTSNGTVMILSKQNASTGSGYNPTGQANVYSLPGTLSQSIQEANNVLIAAQSSVSNPYPNPNKGSTQIDYTFPPGVNEGEIVFYDLQGMEVKRFKVDRTFSTLLISTADIAAGTYYYQLQTSAQSSGGKKMVVIK